MNKILVSFGVAAAFVLAALPVSAQTSVTATVDANTSVTAPTLRLGARLTDASSSTARMRGMKMGSTTAAARAVNLQNRIENAQDRGTNMIDQRVTSLNQVLSRLQGMKFISSADQASLEATIQAQITTMTNLKVEISADTSTTSLKADDQSITKAYRIYALIIPQAEITAAADRVLDIASMLSTVVTKIQARLSADATVSANVSVESAVSDMTAKIADADTQANAAVSEIANLQPDNGVTTVAASNTAALKDARSKMQAAQKDLTAARKDAQTVVQALIADAKSLTASSTATH